MFTVIHKLITKNAQVCVCQKLRYFLKSICSWVEMNAVAPEQLINIHSKHVQV